jgi:hypothetical protein
MKKNIAKNDRMTMGNGGVDPRSAHRFEWIGLGAFVGLLSALALQPVQAQPAIEAPTPAPSAVASQTAAAPERRIDHPADIAALTRFLTDFSPRKTDLERRIAELVGLPEVRLNDPGENLIRGPLGSHDWSFYITYPLVENKNSKIASFVNIPRYVCISNIRWLEMVRDVLELSHHPIKEAKLKGGEVWVEYSNGPDWPIGLVSRSRTLDTGVGVRYYINEADNDKCLVSFQIYNEL